MQLRQRINTSRVSDSHTHKLNNTLDNSNNTRGPNWEVHSWILLTNPAEIAKHHAKLKDNLNLNCCNRPLSNSNISENNATKENQEEGNDGISCSMYLHERYKDFLKHNQTYDGSVKVKLKKEQKGDKTNNTDIRAGIFSVEKNMSDSSKCCNCHGDKKAKAFRAKIFASWILDTFELQHLQQNQVLDIAGGKGKLSIELSTMAQIKCTIIDPMIRGKAGNKLISSKDTKRICKSNGPLPQYIAQSWGWDFLRDEKYEQKQLVENASCLLGMHPDEATEDILDVALSLAKSVAIVPCCVFPCLFPLRKFQDGRSVTSYENFLEYLLEKDNRLKIDTLPFEGKNKVIYFIPQQ